MNVKEIFWTASGLVLCQIEAPQYAFDVPSFRRIIVDHVELTAPTEDHPEGTVVIKGTSPRAKSKWSDSWTLVVDRASGYVDDAHWWVLTPKHGDSDKWGFVSVVLGLPGIIVCSPLLLPWWGFRKLLFKATGLNAHQWALWRKIRGQLHSEVAPTVLAALRKQNTEGLWTYQADKARREKARKDAK